MQYDGLAWAVALLAVLALLVALRILLNTGWFLGWLRGTCGLAFLALAGLVGLVAYDLYAYEPLQAGKPLVTLSFKADGPQRYQVTLLEGSRERTVTLEGDMWQLDGRLIRWKGLAGLIGLEPGYRLERLSGRFLAIEQQALAQHGRVQLAESPYGIDLWRWLRLNQRDLLLFDPQALRVTYLPIAADAVYSVSLTPTGLLAEPMNSAAEAALKDW
ncbi:membrane protein [Ectopseudomonas mendocina]|uniref:membrane protein n=1 Tax=Ectopseudomonas mendocina TaxID=300 RepID=UPI0005A848A9|nr:membrane protein [Pseudomonas mendocina]VEE15593.1 membrane protein [Pseudomonas mendocina]